MVVNGLWQYCGYAAWRALTGNTPYVVFTHGMLDPYFRYAFPLKHIKKWIYWVPFEYRVLRDAYRVLFTSKAEKRLAEQSFSLHQWNAYVVPYGASGPKGDPEVSDGHSSRSALRSRANGICFFSGASIARKAATC